MGKPAKETSALNPKSKVTPRELFLMEQQLQEKKAIQKKIRENKAKMAKIEEELGEREKILDELKEKRGREVNKEVSKEEEILIKKKRLIKMRTQGDIEM